jgi:iron complex transport system substrate-binding protein
METQILRLLRWMVPAALLALASLGPLTDPANAQQPPDGVQVWGTVPPKVERVFAAGPPAGVLIAVVAPEKLIGWPFAPSGKAKALLPPDIGSLPEVGRFAGRGSTSSPEAVAALKPDLILDTGEVSPSYISMAERVQRQTGIAYALINGKIGNSPAVLRQAGKLLQAETRGEELAEFAERLIAEVTSKIATLPADKRPRVYFARGPHGLETGLKGSINSELIDFLGADNIAGESSGSGIATVSMEQVMRWDPDIILVEQASFASQEGNDSFFRDGLRQESWQGLRAVREHHVYLVPSAPFGWVDGPPGVNRLIGLSWLAAKLYPEQFQADLRDKVQSFYKAFYRVSLSDSHLDSLLGDRAAQ